MASIAASKNLRSLQGTDLISQFRSAMRPSAPWESIIDFATHPSFSNLRLYPRQQTLLKLIYLETENMTAYDIDVIEEWREGFKDKTAPSGVQEDIWERVEFLKANGYTHFPTVLGVQGRRASKGMIGGILGAERMGYMVSLDDPQDHFGLAEGKTLWLSVLATNILQAKKFLFADVRQVVEGNEWLSQRIATSNEYSISLRTNADLRLIAKYRTAGLPIDREIASIRAEALSPTSSAGRGGSGFGNFYDEFAHMITGTGGPKDSAEVWCLDPETKILMGDGSLKEIGEVQVGDQVQSVDEENPQEIVLTDVRGKWEFPDSETYEIEMEDGSTVRCSGNHRWLTQRGWVRTDELTEEDYILEGGDFNEARDL